jgi:hypothetical protein
MEIDASNKIDAAEMAKKRFCVNEDENGGPIISAIGHE